MAKVKIGMTDMSIPNKIQRARNIVLQMTGNANNPAPNPRLADVTTAINALESSYEAALDAGSEERAIRDRREEEFDAIIGLLANNVQDVSKGDEIKILSSGFQVRDEAAPSQDLPAPENLKGKTGPNEGEGTLDWKGVRGGASYIIQRSPDGQNSWVDAGVCTASKCVVRGLDGPGYYFFRVAAVGPKGVGAWSDVVKVLIG